MVGIGPPNFVTLDDAKLDEFACIKKLEEIEKYAPEYRQKYLQNRVDVA